MPKATVLIAEDEKAARGSLAALLASEGFHVLTADDGSQALAIATERHPDVVLMDIRMPMLDGLAVLKKMREAKCDSAVVVMTAFGTSATAIEAMKLGAFDYVTKPLDIGQVVLLLERAVEHLQLAREVRMFRDCAPPPSRISTMVGHSPSMQQVYKLIGQLSAADSTVLVRGESGTGKELVVNAIHEHSGRGKGALVKINCASIPESLLESELFGHEKGAFTSAAARRIGRFEQADGGTLFLDEIGELTMPLQAKLLRALQERTIERLGSNTPIHLNIRLITATARDLEKEVVEGRFREDLYYRLNVVSIALPPLRERKQDIPALVQHFLRRVAEPVSIVPDALSALCGYSWPGNVRELENVIERAIVLAHNRVITVDQIRLGAPLDALHTHWTELLPVENGFKDVIAAAERAMVQRALKAAGGSKTKAAEILKIQRRLLYEKMHEYGLK